MPGIRPGEQTARYLDHILNRLTFIGAIYITVICLMPMILQSSFWYSILFGWYLITHCSRCCYGLYGSATSAFNFSSI